MKKFILSLLVIMLLIPSVVASAETTTREIRFNLYEDYSDCVINISWENSANKASVRLEDSDKNSVSMTAANTQYGDGCISVNVGKAASGYWTAYVTGSDLGIINITGGEKYTSTAETNAIRAFTAEVANDALVFNWDVVSEADDVNVSIRYSAAGRNNYSLWSDYSAPKKGGTKVSLDEFYTGLYNFTLEVYDGRSEYTMSIPEPMYIKQKNAPPKLENIKIGSIDGQLYATWDGMYEAGGYIVTVYDYDTLDCINYYTSYDPYITLYDIPASGKFKISVAAVVDNVRGEFDVSDMVYTTPVGTITFPERSVLRSSIVNMTVNCGSDVTAGVYVDKTLLLENAESGEYDLNLTEGTHEIIAYLRDENGNIITFPHSITIDKTPPMINLLSETDTVASETYIIEGNTEPSAVISINGVEQQTSDGKFAAQVSLKDGVNSFSLTAYDAAGNSSSKTLIVEKSGSGRTDVYIYIIPAIVFVLLTIWYIYLNVKSRKGDKK